MAALHALQPAISGAASDSALSDGPRPVRTAAPAWSSPRTASSPAPTTCAARSPGSHWPTAPRCVDGCSAATSTATWPWSRPRPATRRPSVGGSHPAGHRHARGRAGQSGGRRCARRIGLVSSGDTRFRSPRGPAWPGHDRAHGPDGPRLVRRSPRRRPRHTSSASTPSACRRPDPGRAAGQRCGERIEGLARRLARAAAPRRRPRPATRGPAPAAAPSACPSATASSSAPVEHGSAAEQAGLAARRPDRRRRRAGERDPHRRPLRGARTPAEDDRLRARRGARSRGARAGRLLRPQRAGAEA